MLPERFIERLKNQEYINTEVLKIALKEPSPVSIRINHLKWARKPFNAEPVGWCNNGYYLNVRPSYILDPLFHAGCYYPQEASSMFLEQVFRQITDNKDYIKVLDLCGAPGGKSTHLSSMIGQKGILVANEVIRQRATILNENVTKWGQPNCIVTQNDPSAFTRLPGFFNLILLDAPCSGEGMFRDQIAINEWSGENTAHCAERQKRILMDIWPSLKENGILIYSTCTFNPGENEKNIKWLTGKYEAETVKLDISDYKGITEIDFEGIRGYGFYPGKVKGEGLFISVLRKTGHQNNYNFKDKARDNMKVSREERSVATDWFHYHGEELVKSGDSVFAVPGRYEDVLSIKNNLRVIKQGTRLFTSKKKNFLPDHELSMSIQFMKKSFPSVNLDLNQALAYLSRESIIIGEAPKGWINVLYEDVSLGFLNNIGNRTNNYYPVEWRIRMSLPGNSMGNIVKWKL